MWACIRIPDYITIVLMLFGNADGEPDVYQSASAEVMLADKIRRKIAKQYEEGIGSRLRACDRFVLKHVERALCLQLTGLMLLSPTRRIPACQRA